MQQLTLTDLPPRISVAELQPLPEINEEIHQPEGFQEVGHLLFIHENRQYLVSSRIDIPIDPHFCYLSFFLII